MSWLKALGGFLFGGGDAGMVAHSDVMTVAKGVGNWIDEQQFTPQEQSAANAQNLQLVLKAVELTRDENSTRSVTRRVLAWAIMGSFLAAFWLAVILTYLAHVPIKPLLEIMDTFMLAELALAVGSFYFMVSLVRSRK